MHQCHFALDCGVGVGTAAVVDLPAMVGPFDAQHPTWVSLNVPWSIEATAQCLYKCMSSTMQHWTSDDISYALMLFLNQFLGSPINWVKHTMEATWEKDPICNAQEFISMITKCQDCIVNCLQEPLCQSCIGKLMQIDPNNQVTSYQTIVSYKSEALHDFFQVYHDPTQCL